MNEKTIQIEEETPVVTPEFMAKARAIVVDKLRDALIERDYRLINRIWINANASNVELQELFIYSKGPFTVVMFRYIDGSADLYQPLTQSIRIDDTIAAIPGQKTYTCKRCGGANVEGLEWVNMNTLQWSSPNEGARESDQFCNDCQEHVRFEVEEGA